MTEAVRIGLIGCGRLAEIGYVPALARAGTARLVAVADPDPLRRRLLAGGTPGYVSGEELLGAGGVDAVIVATPTGAHLREATLASDAGVPALVEKPPAPDAREAARLAALSPPPWIGFNRRFSPAVAALRARPDSDGSAHRLLHLEMSYRRRTWRPLCSHDDALLDLGPHLVDLARWLSGQEIRTVTSRRVVSAGAQFELGLARGHARVRCAVDRPYRERVQLRGADGRRRQVDSGSVLAQVRQRLAAPRRESPLVASLTAQVQAFALAVRGDGGGALASAADGAAAMAVVDAVRRSAAERRSVTLEDARA